MTQVPATCTVDDLGSMMYCVEVMGALDYSDHRRTYTLKATSEKAAAMEGLDRFVEEMQNLDALKNALKDD